MWKAVKVQGIKRIVKDHNLSEFESALKTLEKMVKIPFTSESHKDEHIFLIHYVVLYGTKEMLSSLINKYEGVICHVTVSGKTALHFAIMRGKNDMVSELINYGADVDAADTTKLMTPLHIAVEKHNLQAVKLLLDGKADVNKLNRQGETAIYIAEKNNNKLIVQELELQSRQEGRRDLRRERNAYSYTYSSGSSGIPPKLPPLHDVSMYNGHAPVTEGRRELRRKRGDDSESNYPGSSGLSRCPALRDISMYNGHAPVTETNIQVQAKRRIQENFEKLVSNIRYNDIFPSLFEKNLLRDDDMERLGKEHLTTREKMVKFFCECLFKGSEDDYNRFVQVLDENNYTECADLIRSSGRNRVAYTQYKVSATREGYYNIEVLVGSTERSVASGGYADVCVEGRSVECSQCKASVASEVNYDIHAKGNQVKCSICKAAVATDDYYNSEGVYEIIPGDNL